MRLRFTLLMLLVSANVWAVSPHLEGDAVVGRVCEFVAPATKVDDPAACFDPARGALDAEFVTPSGKRFRVPGFYMIPHEARVVPAETRQPERLRLYVAGAGLKAGRKIELLYDDVRLVNRKTGKQAIVDDFEGALNWEAQGDGVRVARETSTVHGGKGALRLSFVASSTQWPGCSMLIGADWSGFDQLRFRVRPVLAKGLGQMGVEFHTPSGAKHQKGFPADSLVEGEWNEIVWSFASQREVVAFDPSGEAEWRVRLLPTEAGRWMATFTSKGAAGDDESRLSFDVAPAESDGLARVSPRDPRYLEFASGRAWFPNGINLLGKDLAYYKHFVSQLSDNGGDFIRIWLSPRTMGFELESGVFAHDKAAQLDALLDFCEERGVYVMACLTDFREVCVFHEHGYWDQTAYHTNQGGPLTKAEAFFTDRSAREQYKRKLRYAVARWSAHPALMSWEFFNEVNITDGWRKNPASVRDWHDEMGSHLKSLDSTGRIVTSSFAGLEDDALWEIPSMEIVQRHQYQRAGIDFVETLAPAVDILERHGKPVLVGEFGRRKNEHADLDSEGVSLHNGVWAAAMSGACGASMSWWWQWMDDYDLWKRLDAFGEFADGVDWPGESFKQAELATSGVIPDDAPRYPISIGPKNRGFKPAPFNKPVTVHVGQDGSIDWPELLANILHGLKNHPELHNPVTFKIDYKRKGLFIVRVQGVSCHGGAGLTISVDGKTIVDKDFASRKDDADTITRYDGGYSVEVPKGRHTIVVENKGADWLTINGYDLVGVDREAPLHALALRGRNTSLVWLWNSTHRWDKEVLDRPAIAVSDAKVLAELGPGVYRVRQYDPWEARWTDEEKITVGADGWLAVEVPLLLRDIAWRIERTDR